ncbi:MAG: glycosyltransferase family 39 protein [Pyrinomonadaceae bacterium]
MTKTETQSRKTSYIWIVLFVLAIFVYFFGLTIPLVGPDEPRYAQVAREMFERSDWITPTLGGHHWFEKPALLYWLQIVSYHIFGVTEFAARFGPALFGLGTILSLWILGKYSSDQKPENDFAKWLALTAASSLGLIVFSHGASFDIILTFQMTAALVSFYIFDTSEHSTTASPRFRTSVSLIAFYFFIGISLIAKGLVGIVFPFAIVAFYYLLSWKFPSKIFILSLLWGTILAAFVAATWYMSMYMRHGNSFIDEFFIQHHFQRYTSNKYFHPQPFYFFFWVLPLMTIPWLPFFVAAIWDFVKKFTTQSPLLIFAAAWLAVPLVFFSFSGSKLPGYILPAVPAAIILTAEYIWRFIEKNQKRAVFIQSIAITTFVAVVAVLIFAVPRFAEGDSVKGLIAAADARGMSGAKVLSLHTTSHNAEFYAAGRLLRAEDGKQKKLLGAMEVFVEIRRSGGNPVLVLVPLEYLRELMDCEPLNSEVLRKNDELAIVYVSAK